MANARSAFDNPLEEAEALIVAGRPGEAAALLGRLIGEGRGGLLARLKHARALLAAGDAAGALTAAREMANLHPTVAEAAIGLGEALLAIGQLPAAIAEFQRALRIDPALAEARLLLGSAWLEAGEAEKALAAFAELAPDTLGLSGKIAQAEAMRARPRSDPGYVRHLFDQFSADYDARMLSQLSYRAPEVLRALMELTMPGAAGLAILDLGCGTGLSGAAFRDKAARLDGIDLSPAMIAKARQRGIYDHLRVGDIEQEPDREAYDLVIAADTLVYLGDLEPLTRTVARTLKPGGVFLFTAESKAGDGYELGPKRRWRHSAAYLRGLAGAHGFEIVGLIDCVPRTEAGVPVEGFAVALRRRS